MQKINSFKLAEPFSKGESFEKGFFNLKKTFIHPSSIIGPNVILDENVKIGPFCTIFGKVKIGSNTRIHGYTIIGAPAQVVGMEHNHGHIEIGKNCELREFIAVHSSRYENGKTTIGDNCYIMNYCHIAHDVTLENNVTLINNVSLGGHVYIEHHAFIMANAMAHQFCKIGAYASLAPLTGIRQDIPPFGMFDKQPGKFVGLNKVAMKRSGFTSENINNLNSVAKLFYQEKLPYEKIKEIAQTEPWGKDKSVKYFLQFIENSKRCVSRKSILDK